MRGRIAFLLGLAAAENLAFSGCGPTWPDVRPTGQAWFLAGRGGVATIDLLPIDVAVGSDGKRGSPQDIGPDFEARLTDEIAGALARRGYQLNAVIDWDGGYVAPDGQPAMAMSREDLGQTAEALASYGFAASRAPGHLPVPLLPARLGAATGSDATLYVGGYAFSGDDPSGVDAGDVAKGVLIAVFIVVVVAVLIAAGKHGGGGGGIAHAGVNGAARVVSGAGHLAFHGVARLCHTFIHAGRPFVDLIDVFGRTSTHIDIYVAHADEVPRLPERGDSQTLLEMTLIDNRTGQALWHARQVFPANPARPEHIAASVSRLLGTLPPRR
jgi:hypothetical protein